MPPGPVGVVGGAAIPALGGRGSGVGSYSGGDDRQSHIARGAAQERDELLQERSAGRRRIGRRRHGRRRGGKRAVCMSRGRSGGGQDCDGAMEKAKKREWKSSVRARHPGSGRVDGVRSERNGVGTECSVGMYYVCTLDLQTGFGSALLCSSVELKDWRSRGGERPRSGLARDRRPLLGLIAEPAAR